jgi:hypothetical protein
MREDLIGYFLGALDRDAEEQVAKKLAEHPALRRELDFVGSCLTPLAADPDVEPPPGLADRTIRMLRQAPAAPRIAPPPATETAGFIGSWRLTDLAVAASILIMIGIVIAPAISQSRQVAQLTACKNNLRQIGIGMESYAEQFARHYPFVSASGPLAVAGMYAPVLLDTGHVSDPAVFICPSSHDDASSIPSLSRVRDALDDVQQLSRLAPSLGGSYAYSLGFKENGVYHPPSRAATSGSVFMTDRPTRTSEGDVGNSNSPNHGGRGQNALCIGGNVKYLTTPAECTGCDNLFMSQRNRVEPGANGADQVIGVSEARLDAADDQF